jgi:N-acetylated-alpha-linked acidic dipeptidase
LRPVRLFVPALVLFAICALPPARASAGEAPLLGFDPQAAAEERTLESRFDAGLKAEDLREWAERLSSRPHHVGSAWDQANAEWMESLFRSWGYETRIETYDVLFPTPLVRQVEMVAPRSFKASLVEPALPEDHTSGQAAEQLPTYNAYSSDGDVTADLVYVNYGVPKDYEELALRGIDVRGKIVIARYGGSWRGIKPKVAAEKGAVGCLIYSDPRGDGYFEGDVYPKGGYRNEHSVQRGSVADMPVYSGDPLTPGVAATKDAKRLPLSEAATLTRIPTLPLSWDDARPLLESLGGPVAPEDWRGALPITYHLGPGPARVHLKAAFDWKTRPVRDVIAIQRGSQSPDEWVIRGNHHDAWVNGATDPVSGMVAVLAEARAVSELVRSGWRPRRTIVYAAWDGEEPGLLGSTEWVEDHEQELEDKAVAYVNSDSNSRGYLSMEGSHSLERFLNQVARDVPDPRTGESVAERLRARTLLEGDEGNEQDKERREDRQRALDRSDLRIGALGSGSDYTPFLQHAGVASLNVGFDGEGDYGQYHSIYDSFDHYLRFMDPDFSYGVALARVGGRTVLRLAQAEVLPFEFTAFADTVAEYVQDLQKETEKMRRETDEETEAIARHAYAATAPPGEERVAPERKAAVPFLDFAPLQNAVRQLRSAARKYDAASAAAPAASGETRRALNALLRRTEHALTRGEGLPGRPWYRHYVYAPGVYTGYGVKTLPAAREAIELRRWEAADAGIATTAEVLFAFAGEVERAAAILGGSAGDASEAGR